MPHRILFVASHRPGRAPSQRFRFEQYREWLATKGFESELSQLVTPWFDRRIYRSGHLAAKALFALRSRAIRRRDLARVADYDLVFVHREALMTRGRWFERALARSPVPFIFDYDDAIWMPTRDVVSQANRRLRWMKDPAKTGEIVQLADTVVAGNDFLADYARRRGADRVYVIPTTIDTDYFRTARDRSRSDPDRPVCIGWSGSPTTVPHFETAIEALEEIQRRYGTRVRLKVIGDGAYRSERLGVRGLAWSLEDEVPEVDDIDIGIMPLPDDEWVKGKCGFKALMYMSFEIPTVLSPVGVNPEIVDDGRNGLHASTTEEWVAALSRLIDDAELRLRLGRAGRETVLERYSVRSQRERYLEVLEATLRKSSS